MDNYLEDMNRILVRRVEQHEVQEEDEVEEGTRNLDRVVVVVAAVVEEEVVLMVVVVEEGQGSVVVIVVHTDNVGTGTFFEDGTRITCSPCFSLF